MPVKIKPIRVSFDYPDSAMSRTVFYEKFSTALKSSRFYVEDPESADIRFGQEDTAMETNWPRYGNPASAFLRGIFDTESHRDYIKFLMARSEPICVLNMHPSYRLSTLLRSRAHMLFADVNLRQVDRVANPRTISMPALPFMTGAGGTEDRRLLASFRGANSHPVREALTKLRSPGRIVVTLTDSQNHAGIIDAENGVGDRDYCDLLRQSVFAFVPRGDHEFSYRLLEVMSFGCVPIVISDGLVPPFDRIIDWRRCAISVPEARIAEIPDMLDGLDASAVARLRAASNHVYQTYLRDLNAISRSLIAELSILFRTVL
jgi:hypothetical protein